MSVYPHSVEFKRRLGRDLNSETFANLLCYLREDDDAETWL